MAGRIGRSAWPAQINRSAVGAGQEGASVPTSSLTPVKSAAAGLKQRRGLAIGILAFQALIAIRVIIAMGRGHWASAGAGALVLLIGGGLVAATWEGTKCRT